MSHSFSLWERWEIAESSFGREYGWYVELASGERVAELVERQLMEMFWDSYLVVPLHGHAEVHTREFWYPACHCFRNRQFTGGVVESFGHFDPETKRATLRSLYLPVDISWFEALRAPMRYWRLRRRVERTEYQARTPDAPVFP